MNWFSWEQLILMNKGKVWQFAQSIETSLDWPGTLLAFVRTHCMDKEKENATGAYKDDFWGNNEPVKKSGKA